MKGYKFFKGNASSSGTLITYPFNHIKYISNDGDGVIFVSMNFRRDVFTGSTGFGDEIELKAGEVLNDLSLDVSRIRLRSDNNVPYRVLGVTQGVN